jgi:hypothetical protein
MRATEWLVTVSHRLGPGRSRLASIHRTRSRKRARRLAREQRRAGHDVAVMKRCPGCPWTVMGEKLRRRGHAASYLGGMRFSYPVASPTLFMDGFNFPGPRIGGIVAPLDMREALTTGH